MQNDLFFPAKERLKVAPANQSSKMQDGWGAFAGRFEQAIHFARRVGMLLGPAPAQAATEGVPWSQDLCARSALSQSQCMRLVFVFLGGTPFHCRQGFPLPTVPEGNGISQEAAAKYCASGRRMSLRTSGHCNCTYSAFSHYTLIIVL